jgi:hypothetical protein
MILAYGDKMTYMSKVLTAATSHARGIHRRKFAASELQ